MVRSKWIDISKGIAIICVVIGHIGTSYHSSELFLDSMIMNFAIKLVYSFHMTLFFVISGLLASVSDEKHQESVLLKRIISYGIPYIVFSLIAWLLKTIASGVVNNKVSLDDLIKIPLFPISSLWFIYALLLSSLLHFIIKKYVLKNGCNQGKIILYLILLFVIRIAAIYYSRIDIVVSMGLNECILFSVGKYFFWYEFGSYLYDKLRKKLSKFTDNWIVLVTSGVIYFFIQYLFLIVNFENAIIDSGIALIGVVIVSAISLKIEKNKALAYIGQNSFPIYLLHPYVVSMGRIVLKKIGIPALGGITPLLLLSIASTGIPLVTYVVLSKIKMVDFLFYPSKYILGKKVKK